MTRANRLFLFAGYDREGIIDNGLVYHVKSLSKLGDIIVCMDSDCSNKELSKLSPYTLAIFGKRHGEYDFGSYKRAYNYAKQNKLLQKYNYIYMVNDSVYGPLYNLEPILKKLESFETDVFGIVKSKHRVYAPIESWFIGMKTKIAKTKWFEKFITSVKQLNTKNSVTVLYENGFTDLINKHNISWKCALNLHGRATYNRVKYIYKHGCPFVKKGSFTRHNGALGNQVNYVLNKSDAKNVILSSANRVYGEKYMTWFLTSNPIKIIHRKITYTIQKIKQGQI